MPAALLVRFRPAGPWRLGPDNGARDRTDGILHSDAVYSALTIAMRDLGWLEDWVAATAEAADPAVRLTSCYPWTGRLLMVEPPRSLWPMEQTGKLRWKSARFVPVSLIPALIREETLKEEDWAVDPVSECLLPVTRNGPMHPPFRVARRKFAAVDRLTGTSESARESACLQFAQSSGMWLAAVFASDEARDTWSGRFRSACRLLADTGLGGGRSQGWGRSDDPRFETVADWGRMLTGAAEGGVVESAWWLLSLYSPGPSDAVDWKRGNYELRIRAGRMESLARWGELKPATRMVAEGSVLVSAGALKGAVRNVAAAEDAHPVYRSGIAVAVAIPWKESRRTPWATAESGSDAPAVVEVVSEAPVLEEAVPAPVIADEIAVDETSVEVEEGTMQEPVVEEPVVEQAPEQAMDEPSPDPVIPVEEPPSIDPLPDEPPVEEPPVTEPEPDELPPGPSEPEPDPNREGTGP